MRSSQFMLGDTPINYQTSSQAQSELIPEKGRINNRLTDEQKQKLQRSQFSLGSSKNDFSTDYNLEYYDKSALYSKVNPNELKAIRDKLRGSNYDMGSDKLNYISENMGKYKKPEINYEELRQAKLQTEENTKNLRSGHFDLGTDNNLWNSSNRETYTPKKIDNNRYINRDLNNLIRSGNFQKVEENRDFKSETRDSYNRKPLQNNRVSDEYRINLRRNHFDIGDSKAVSDMNTVNRVDFKDPRLDKNHSYGSIIIDPNRFRKSQWSLNGGNNGNYFNTTYSTAMTPKKPLTHDISNNANLHTSIQIGNDKMNQQDYQSVYTDNYGNKNLFRGNYYINNSDKNLVNNIKNFNKNSKIEMFKGRGDYKTTMNDCYRYNPNDAKKAFNPLDLKKKLNLRGSQYQLGENNEIEKETSNRRDYRAYPIRSIERIDSSKRNMESMDMGNNNIFDAATIYQTDYTKKPFPKEDNDIDLYLDNKYNKGNQ